MGTPITATSAFFVRRPNVSGFCCAIKMRDASEALVRRLNWPPSVYPRRRLKQALHIQVCEAVHRLILKVPTFNPSLEYLRDTLLLCPKNAASP